jgi:hypothetical protein
MKESWEWTDSNWDYQLDRVMPTQMAMKVTRGTQRMVPRMVIKSSLITKQKKRYLEGEQGSEDQAPKESSGAGGQRPFSRDLKQRVRQLERIVQDLLSWKGKPGGSFQGVKLRPANSPKFGGGKKVIKDWLATMVQWLGSTRVIAPMGRRSFLPRPS